MLKKLILALAICHLPFAIAHAQFAATIDTTTLTTNSYTLTFTLTVTNPVAGPGLTNGAACEVNTNYVVAGDPPLTESFKINQGFTNAWNFTTSLSNFTFRVSANFTSVSNNFTLISNNFCVLLNDFSNLTNGFSGLTNKLVSITADGSGDVTNSGAILAVGGFILPQDNAGFTHLSGLAQFGNPLGGNAIQFFDAGAVSFNSSGGAGSLAIGSAGDATMANNSAGQQIYLDGSGIIELNTFSGSQFDWDSAYTDGSGNFYAPSFNVTSDRNVKTNIIALSDPNILARLCAVPVYRWQFKSISTTNRIGTNLIAHIRPISPVHIGPMAQDWGAQFGGQTNAIGVTDMQGLLLAGEQAIAALQGTLTNAAGARFRLLVNAQTNGIVFVPW